MAVEPSVSRSQSQDRIQPNPENPWYWMYGGEPIFLIGGSDDDNPYQWPTGKLIGHLDLLVSVGGNFVRNTMSTRDEGNVTPYEFRNGGYELSQWNDDFWQKLELFLQETAKRNILVQLTLWDQHDFVASNWKNHFWNPENNGIGLEASRVYDDHAFFSSVKDRNALVLPYQIKYIEKVLSYTLQYNHVLYNISNEGWAGLEWEVYWAEMIRKEAKLAGKEIEVTTMEHGPRLSVDAVLRNPSVFSYFELSQNNNASTGYNGHEHWKHIMTWRSEILDTVGPRPLLNEKIYGARDQRPSFGNEEAAVHRFWRNTFAGSSGVRFHRPDSGLGLGETARRHIRALRLFTKTIGIVDTRPAPDLIVSSTHQETYCLLSETGKVGLYLVEGGEVSLKLYRGSYRIEALNLEEGLWSEIGEVKVRDGAHPLKFPDGKSQVVLLSPM